MNKLLSRAVRKCIAALPAPMADPIIRRGINLNLNPPSDLKIKLAETAAEHDAAYRLLHDSYVAQGYMKPHPSGLRFTLWHALTSTSVIVAKKGDQVIGTFSLIRDNVCRLPIESIYDLTPYRKPGIRIGEWSALAVDPQYRGLASSVYMLLVKYIYRLTWRDSKLDYYCLTTHPKQFLTYRAIFLADAIAQPLAESYHLVNGNPAVGSCIQVDDIAKKLQSIYGDKAKNKNVYWYLVKSEFSNLIYPDRHFAEVSSPAMPPDVLAEFLGRSGLWTSLTFEEKVKIASEYDHPSYAGVFKLGKHTLHRRKAPRIPLYLVARQAGDSTLEMTILDASESGFRACVAAGPMPKPGSIRLVVDCDRGHSVTIEAKLIRRASGGIDFEMGFLLEHPPPEWRNMVAGAFERMFGHGTSVSATGLHQYRSANVK